MNVDNVNNWLIRQLHYEFHKGKLYSETKKRYDENMSTYLYSVFV